MKIVIRAGGTGTRLWPLSRSGRPKQFLPIFEDGGSCVQLACRRFIGAGLVEAGDVFVSTGACHEWLAREQLPELPPENFIVEPARMDTAAAIALETIAVAGDDPDVIIASLGSDHYAGRPHAFVEALRGAEVFLSRNPDKLLAVACRPTRIETGYGHIKLGRKLEDCRGLGFFEVEQFTEKPDYRTAKEYTESGEYLWNANFFAWTSGALMSRLREFEPEMHGAFMRILQARGSARFDEKLKEIYPSVKKTAIDYAVLEPAAARGGLAAVPVSMEWSDIGSWAGITDAFPPDECGNLFRAPVLGVDCSGCTIFADNPGRKLIAAVGLEGLAVVDTEDALLIIPRDRAGEVKDLVGRLRNDPDCRRLT